MSQLKPYPDLVQKIGFLIVPLLAALASFLSAGIYYYFVRWRHGELTSSPTLNAIYSAQLFEVALLSGSLTAVVASAAMLFSVRQWIHRTLVIASALVVVGIYVRYGNNYQDSMTRQVGEGHGFLLFSDTEKVFQLVEAKKQELDRLPASKDESIR